MRWEITVATHLFVTCRTGFHSAAGEVASRPGRGGGVAGRGRRGGGRRRAPSTPLPCRTSQRECQRSSTGVSEGTEEGREGGRGRGNVTWCSQAPKGDETRRTGPGAPRAPGEARSRRAGLGGPVHTC